MSDNRPTGERAVSFDKHAGKNLEMDESMFSGKLKWE